MTRDEVTSELTSKDLKKLRREFTLVAQEVWVDDDHRVDFVGFKPLVSTPYPAAQQSGLPKDKNGDPVAAGSYVMIEEHFTASVYEVVAVDNSGVFYRMRTENCSDWEENWTSPDGYSLVYKCGKCVELLHDSWKKLRDDLDECVSKGGSRGIGKEAAAKFADRAAKLAEVE